MLSCGQGASSAAVRNGEEKTGTPESELETKTTHARLYVQFIRVEGARTRDGPVL